MKFTHQICVLWLAAFAAQAAATPPVVTVNPAVGQLRPGEKLTFSAKIGGITSTAVDWKVVSAGLNSGDVGTITSAGIYTAPALPPGSNVVTIEAINRADSASLGKAAVTLLNPIPAVVKLSPAEVNTGLAYTAAITGTGFMAKSQVTVDGKAITAFQVLSATSIQLTGTTTAAAGTKFSIAVVNPDPGGKSSNAATLSVIAPVSITVSPEKPTLRLGETLLFAARLTNTSNTNVTWQVNGKTGGSIANGAIDVKGLYTAPTSLPAAAIQITALSQADPAKSATVSLTLDNALPVITSFAPKLLPTGQSTLTVNGTGFANGATIHFGGAAVATKFVSDKQLTAAITVSLPAGGLSALKVSNPDPGGASSAVMVVPVAVANPKMAYLDAVRFLEMATFGPTPESIEHIQTIGRDAWLAEQFAMPASAWPDPTDSNEGLARLQDAFFTIALSGKDQLRQRVSLALAEIMVASGIKDTKFQQMVGYQRLLGDEAFSTYRDLLGKMTLNPAMGIFLDMVNNDKANPTKGTVANENYAREVMQLFTLGLVQTDAAGQPLPGNPAEYDQDTVTAMAKVFTGWTFGTEPGFSGHFPNPEYDFVPMQAFAEHHDETQKIINLPIPCTIGAGGTPLADLSAALDCIYKQQNVAPFVSYRLIQRLVKSAPSTQYTGRVAAVFNATKGDLKAVVTAVLTDTEALTEGTGKLREPILQATTLLRELDVTVSNGAATGVSGQSNAMGQMALTPPSVFSYFSPSFRISGFTPPPVAPEFQSINAETDFGRANFAFRAVTNGISGNVKVDFTNWQDLAAVPASLVEAINQALYRGEMTSDEKAAVMQGAAASTNALTSVRDAVYVAAGAPQYQVVK